MKRPILHQNVHRISLIYCWTLVPLMWISACAPHAEESDSVMSDDGSKYVGKENVPHGSYAEISFGNGVGTEMIYRMDDQREIQEAILAPLSSAVTDPDPARYEITGTLRIYQNGEATTVVLFIPWGRIKVGKDYKIADLSKLRDVMRDFWSKLDSSALNFEEYWNRRNKS